MFTLIRNYRTLFMLTIAPTLERAQEVAGKTGNASRIEQSDIDALEGDELAIVKAVLPQQVFDQLAQGKYFGIGEGSTLDNHGYIDALNAAAIGNLQARSQVASNTHQVQQTHRTNVEANSAILSGNRLNDAIRYINSMDEEQRNALGQALPGIQRHTGEAAQAVALFQSQNGLTVDGKPGNLTITALNIQTQARSNNTVPAAAGANTAPDRAPEAPTAFHRTLHRGLRGADVQALQVILTNKGFDTSGTEGTFGSGTERALKNYQRQVLRQGGDGVMDLNGATMRSLVSGGGTTQETTASNSVNEEAGILNPRQRLRAQIENDINMAKTPHLMDLGHEAVRAKISGNRGEINRVYGEVFAALETYISDEAVVRACRVMTQAQKIQVLDYFSNAMKGNAGTAQEAARNTSSENYILRNSGVINKAIGVVSEAGLSFANQSKGIAQSVASNLSGSLESTNLGEGVYFSVRTQGNLNVLEPQTRGAEALIVNGISLYEISENQNDMLRIAGMLTQSQLNVIDANIRYNGVGVLTQNKLIKFIEDGDVTLDVQMYIEENCSNIAYKVVPSGDVYVTPPKTDRNSDNVVVGSSVDIGVVVTPEETPKIDLSVNEE